MKINNNLEILKTEYRYSGKSRRLWYNYKCRVCGYEDWMIKGSIDKGCGCSCCAGKVLVVGINDISTTKPDLVKYFSDINDCTKYTAGSNKYVDLKCPFCGNIQNTKISNLTHKGFSCKICSDTIPKTEKTMYSILKQLNLNFEYQYSPKWAYGKKYDFAIFNRNGTIDIIEINGEQHYKVKGYMSKDGLQPIIENDKLKQNNAMQNGISKYIIIPCIKSEPIHLKESIIKSEFGKLYDLNTIDWELVTNYVNESFIRKICEEWISDENATSLSIAKKINVSKTTVKKYLKICASLNLIDYSPQKEIEKNNMRNKEKTNKQSATTRSIGIFKDGVLIDIHVSARELQYRSQEKYGVFLRYQNIWQVCNFKMNKYKGYTFKYMD